MLAFLLPTGRRVFFCIIKDMWSQKTPCITQQGWIDLFSIASQLGGITSFMVGEMGGRQEKVIKSVNALTIPKGIKSRKA